MSLTKYLTFVLVMAAIPSFCLADDGASPSFTIASLSSTPSPGSQRAGTNDMLWSFVLSQSDQADKPAHTIVTQDQMNILVKHFGVKSPNELVGKSFQGSSPRTGIAYIISSEVPPQPRAEAGTTCNVPDNAKWFTCSNGKSYQEIPQSAIVGIVRAIKASPPSSEAIGSNAYLPGREPASIKSAQ